MRVCVHASELVHTQVLAYTFAFAFEFTFAFAFDVAIDVAVAVDVAVADGVLCSSVLQRGISRVRWHSAHMYMRYVLSLFQVCARWLTKNTASSPGRIQR